MTSGYGHEVSTRRLVVGVPRSLLWSRHALSRDTRYHVDSPSFPREFESKGACIEIYHADSHHVSRSCIKLYHADSHQVSSSTMQTPGPFALRAALGNLATPPTVQFAPRYVCQYVMLRAQTEAVRQGEAHDPSAHESGGAHGSNASCRPSCYQLRKRLRSSKGSLCRSLACAQLPCAACAALPCAAWACASSGDAL